MQHKIKIKDVFLLMDTIKISKLDTKMVAHRGVSKIEPENTLAAFELAGKTSYFGIECDVHVTKDKKYVINHDFSLMRTYGVEKNIEELTLSELKEIKNLVNQAPVPEYSQYLEICKKYSKTAVVELKGVYTDEELKGLIEETKKADYLENTVFIAFDLINLIKLRELLPSQKLQFLTSVYNENILDALNRFSLDLDISYKVLTEEIIKEVQNNGHIVNCWTVDDKEIGEELASWGIDIITTNILE